MMVSNNSGKEARRLAAEYPGSVGHLYSPGGQRGPWLEFPYALDNGKFPCWAAGKRWDIDHFNNLLAWAKRSGQAPQWLLVPDEVGDAQKTWQLWEDWADFLRSFGWPLAFAVQDGHAPRDVPMDADVVFCGGYNRMEK